MPCPMSPLARFLRWAGEDKVTTTTFPQSEDYTAQTAALLVAQSLGLRRQVSTRECDESMISIHLMVALESHHSISLPPLPSAAHPACGRTAGWPNSPISASAHVLYSLYEWLGLSRPLLGVARHLQLWRRWRCSASDTMPSTQVPTYLTT